MITLHHLERSRSQRIAWLLEEAGVEYTVKRYSRDPRTDLAPPELKAVHPLGKAPVITDGDRTIAESAAIIEYVVDHYAPHLRPTDPKERLAYTYFMHFAEGSMMPMVVMQLVLSRLGQKPVPFFLRPVGRMLASAVDAQYTGPSLEAQLGLIEDTLGRRPWFAGQALSGADIQMSFCLQAVQARSGLDRWPHTADWLKRAEGRAAYRAAEAQVGPVDLR